MKMARQGAHSACQRNAWMSEEASNAASIDEH